MSDAFSRLRAWFRTALTDSANVQPEATAESIRRFRIFTTLGILANVAYLSYFWWLMPPATTPLQQRYSTTIGLIHAVSAAGLVVFWPLCHHLLRSATMPPLRTRALQVLISAWVIAFGVSLSVADQWVGSNTTNYVMLSLIVAMLALLRPVVSILLFTGAYVVLYNALALTQSDPAMLDMARSHSFTGTVMSLVASIVMWRQYVNATLLRRQLTESNASLEKKQEELSHLATYDALTGLRNRRAFLHEAEHELNRALRYPCETGILIADLDYFKRVNDRHGHPAGDAVLRHFASLLKAQLRDSDIAARLGGEEFIVLLPGTGTVGTAVVAEKIRQAIEATPVIHAGEHIAITVSIGVSSLPANNNCAIDALYGQADQALYAAKAEGRNRVVHAGPSSGGITST
jgi:diguanylate cyclase (GGDEF)-like protein